MRQHLLKNLMVAGVALLAVPSVTFAQKEKEKIKEKEKQTQTIVITRVDGADEKMVIEIDGDKVKVNGKDAKDDKNVNVNVTTTTGRRTRNVFAPGQAMTFSLDDDAFSIYEEDSNRAMLGVTTETDEKGAEVRSVTEGSGAEKAGLKKGDVLTRIGDKEIEDSDDVTKAVRNHKPGDKLALVYLRDGKEQKATAELTKWKGVRFNRVTAPKVPMAQLGGVGRFDHDFDGFDGFQALSVVGRPKLGLSIQDDEDGKGAKVLEVDEESAAEKAGLKKGDIITSIDDADVKGTDDVTRMMRQNREKFNFSFKILRDGKAQTVEVKMPRRLKQADL